MRSMLLLGGVFDISATGVIAHAVAPLLKRQPRKARRSLNMNLGAVSFMDGVGLTDLADSAGALLDCGYDVTVARAQPSLRRLIDLARHDGWLPAGVTIADREAGNSTMSVQTTAAPDGVNLGYDVLLCLAGSVWKQHRDGRPPRAGEVFIVHHSLPDARVCSVVQSGRAGWPGAVLRFPTSAIGAITQQRWERALLGHGWTRHAPDVLKGIGKYEEHGPSTRYI